jgi:uncharacterized protein with von Willebrand factor type A (vWA) domain
VNSVAEPSRNNLLELVVSFSRSLHDAGIPVSSSNLIDLCRCFDYIDIRNRDDFYAAARATLVSDHDDLMGFYRVFSEFWMQVLSPTAKAEDESKTGGGQIPRNTPKDKRLSEGEADTGEEDSGGQLSQLAYSPDEVLMKKDIGAMSAEETEQARRVISELVSVLANYKSRRLVSDRKGVELNFRRMLRRNVLYGNDNVELLYRRRRIQKTRLLLLCDVSGSMEVYSSFLIHFIYALHHQLTNPEIAVFSTRMTVISEFLKTKSVEDSLNQVTGVVHDWAGGTNIGTCLREFNDRFSYEMMRSRTVVIILSDGWDRGDATEMREEMEHLHRRAHKVLWLNPLLRDANYQPLCQGIRTALPFIDNFLPAHNLESLAQVVHQLRTVWD